MPFLVLDRLTDLVAVETQRLLNTDSEFLVVLHVVVDQSRERMTRAVLASVRAGADGVGSVGAFRIDVFHIRLPSDRGELDLVLVGPEARVVARDVFHEPAVGAQDLWRLAARVLGTSLRHSASLLFRSELRGVDRLEQDPRHPEQPGIGGSKRQVDVGRFEVNHTPVHVIEVRLCLGPMLRWTVGTIPSVALARHRHAVGIEPVVAVSALEPSPIDVSCVDPVVAGSLHGQGNCECRSLLLGEEKHDLTGRFAVGPQHLLPGRLDNIDAPVRRPAECQ